MQQARSKTFDAHDGDHFHHVFTGHSLGGGLAQVIAARLGAEALVFSPPGVGYSARRFGIHRGEDYFALNKTRDWFALPARATPEVISGNYIRAYHHKDFGIEVAEHKLVVVKPHSDVVPKVDLQVGLVQEIECRIKRGEFGGAVDCHSMQKTACELWRSCDDIAGKARGRSINCIGNQSWQVMSRKEEGAWYTPDEVV